MSEYRTEFEHKFFTDISFSGSPTNILMIVIEIRLGSFKIRAHTQMSDKGFTR